MQSETVRDLFDNLKHAARIEPGHNYGVSKPRILVCAPSNAAIDNLLERVMSRGFQSLQGAVYWPNIVRVGAADAVVADKVMGVYAGGKVEALMRMSPQEWNDAYLKQDRFVKEAAMHIAFHEREHVRAANATVAGARCSCMRKYNHSSIILFFSFLFCVQLQFFARVKHINIYMGVPSFPLLSHQSHRKQPLYYLVVCRFIPSSNRVCSFTLNGGRRGRSRRRPGCQGE